MEFPCVEVGCGVVTEALFEAGATVGGGKFTGVSLFCVLVLEVATPLSVVWVSIICVSL